MEVVYDPARTSYEQLLAAFWSAHPAVGPPGPSRTREAVLCAGETQCRIALASRQAVSRAAGEPVQTGVLPTSRFWPAEPMHQKANLQRLAPELVRDLSAHGGGRDAFLASTAAAHLNAYAGGFAGDDALAAAAAELGVKSSDLRARIPH